MNRYRLRLTLKGRLGTPLVGDTLFGHLCWGIVYWEGTAALERFLDAMRSPEPPLVIGDPCPAGFLPMPLLPPADLAEAARMEALAASKSLDEEAGGGAAAEPSPAADPRLAAHDRLKRFRKRRWLPVEALARCADDLTAEGLLAADLDRGAEPPVLVPAAVAHNTLNRLTGHTAEEGGLFVQTEYFPDGPEAAFDLYLLSTLDPPRIRTLFEQGLAGGYGADAATGKGHLVVGDLDEAPWPAAREPNAALALGVFSPSAEDPARGFWRTEVRFGKVSGAWAGADDGPHPPFKRPLVLLRAGAVLAPYRRPWLGRVVPNVHPTRTEVVTCALAPALPVRCPALEAQPKEATP